VVVLPLPKGNAGMADAMVVLRAGRSQGAVRLSALDRRRWIHVKGSMAEASSA
jgi:hypothetical protein